MPLDNAIYISEYNAALPTSNDDRAEGDDNFRHNKQVLLNSLPNINAPMTLTSAVINALPGDIAAVQSNLDSESARLDAADLAVQSTLNTTIQNGDDAVRGEFASADTATYNSAVTDAGIAADAYTDAEIDTLRGEPTAGKTVVGAYDASTTVQGNLDSHIAAQAAKDGEQDAAITTIQSQIDDLGAGDTDLDLAKTYTDQQIDALRGDQTNKTVLANHTQIATNTGNIATNTTDISNAESDISALQTTTGTHTSTLNDHEARITTLEGGDPLTMQLIVDTLYPLGSYYFCSYDQNIPAILSQYATWVASNNRAVMYMNAGRSDIISNGYHFVGPQLNDTGGQPSQSVMNSVPVRAYLRTG